MITILFCVKPHTESTPVSSESKYQKLKLFSKAMTAAWDATLWHCTMHCFIIRLSWHTRALSVIAGKKLNQHCVAFEIFCCQFCTLAASWNDEKCCLRCKWVQLALTRSIATALAAVQNYLFVLGPFYAPLQPAASFLSSIIGCWLPFLSAWWRSASFIVNSHIMAAWE